MKNILFSLLFSLILVSCVDNSHKSKEQIEIELTQNKNIDLFNEINKFEYEGHNYIYFQKGYGKNKSSGIVHDPTCSCSN